MVTIQFPDQDLTSEQFVNRMNAARKKKENKGKWISGVAIVDGKYVEVKAFGTWLQIFRVDKVQYGNTGDALVREYLGTLMEPFAAEEKAA